MFYHRKNRLSSKSNFISKTVILILILIAGLILTGGIYFYPQLKQDSYKQKGKLFEAPNIKTYVFDITNEPYEIQIQRVEQKYKPENLKGKNSRLRDEFAWLVVLWFAKDKTLNAFGEPDTAATAARIYRSIEWIEDSSDSRRKDNEQKTAWTTAHESITVDLSQDDAFNRANSSNVFKTGDRYTPLSFLRRTLVHELVHFIGGRRIEALSFSILMQSKPEYKLYIPKYIEGFKIGFIPVPDKTTKHQGVEFLVDFDEAATELIATNWQQGSGWDITPAYSPDVNKAILLLQQTLERTGMTVTDLSRFKSTSDLDGLAKRFAEATGQEFKTDEAKVYFGLWVISAIQKGSKEELESKYWQFIRK